MSLEEDDDDYEWDAFEEELGLGGVDCHLDRNGNCDKAGSEECEFDVAMGDPIRWTVLFRTTAEARIQWHECKPILFKTRRECNDWIHEKYGYIAKRQDLRNPPHNWRMPIPIQVRVKLEPIL